MGNVHRLDRSKALVTSLALSLLFLVVYSGCNWITARRADVGSFYFEWERAMPFVPFFIAPYMSIDLFFVAAPFLCRSNEELRVFAKRIVVAIVVAGICFLAFPLRFAFERPRTGGILGAIFDWFRGMDAPFNLVPSLHAALMLLLVDLYWRRTQGLIRLTIMAWFGLIALSPLLTYQHHVIDIISGLALGATILLAFQNSPSQ